MNNFSFLDVKESKENVLNWTAGKYKEQQDSKTYYVIPPTVSVSRVGHGDPRGQRPDQQDADH